jgi:hypothetical protein
MIEFWGILKAFAENTLKNLLSSEQKAANKTPICIYLSVTFHMPNIQVVLQESEGKYLPEKIVHWKFELSSMQTFSVLHFD